MSSTEVKKENNDQKMNSATKEQPQICCIESVNRISKLPIVESTVQTATTIYSKVKDYNSVTHWTLSTAEGTVNKAIEVGKPIATPVVQSLEGPIKKVDEILCHGLDYVESKVPALKLPPAEMYNNAKEYIDQTVTPKVQTIYSNVEPTIQTAKHMVEPAIQSAKNIVEPAVSTAYHNMVQPAMEKVNHYLHPESSDNENEQQQQQKQQHNMNKEEKRGNSQDSNDERSEG